MMPFTADHRGFYLNGTPFYPLIQNSPDPLMQWSNAALLRLPALLKDDLDWSKEKEMAKELSLAGKYLFWELDLGLSSFQFSPEDTASFYAFSLVIEEFCKQLWPIFENRTFGVSIYRGFFDPMRSFPIARWEAGFCQWALERGLKQQTIPQSDRALYYYELYCAQALSEYLHRLVSFLPDAAMPFALIDISAIASAAWASQFFSKARFEHLNLVIRGAKAPFSGICWEEGHEAQGWLGSSSNSHNLIGPGITAPAIGVLLPEDDKIDALLIQRLDSLLFDLMKKGVAFRVVSEEKLTEQWDGLDKLIVFSSALSTQGKRKLLGFLAAGGEVATIGDRIGLPEEELLSQDVFRCV
jgi:hypothetical protein